MFSSRVSIFSTGPVLLEIPDEEGKSGGFWSEVGAEVRLGFPAASCGAGWSFGVNIPMSKSIVLYFGLTFSFFRSWR